jgi:DNA-binding HxlR family transcriptional regulator
MDHYTSNESTELPWSAAALCVFERLAEEWTVCVLGRLSRGPVHFLALQRSLGAISKRVLSDVLRKLERDGLEYRHAEATGAGIVYS